MNQILVRFRTAVGRSPSRAAVTAFLVAGAFFTALLSLPAATKSGERTALPDALFTAVSAVSVTGLITVNTGEHWSPFGQATIFLAIQAGGLGVVTLSLLLTMVVTHRLGLTGRKFAQQSLGPGNVAHLIRVVVLVTFALEASLAVFLLPSFLHSENSVKQAVWYAVFYAVSAFCNAGFSPNVDGLMPFAGDSLILVPISVGVFVGSLGFPVVLNLLQRRRWSLHTKLTLNTTLILFAAGAVAWAGAEWFNKSTTGGFSSWGKVGEGMFASIMMRSGGFSLVDMDEITTTTSLLSSVLMFIGGGSASTAGGIKVTTFAVLILAIVAESRGTLDSTAFGRTIAYSTLRLAISVGFLGLILVLSAATLLSYYSDAPLDRILFETISAFATCGLTNGFSAESGVFGKIVLSALMLMGRIGPIALAASLAVRHQKQNYKYPVERPIIG